MTKMDGRKLDRKTLEHLRKLAVKRVVEAGEQPSAVMDSFGLCRTTVYPWLRQYQDEGLEALVEKICQGPQPALDEQQRQQVRGWIIGKAPGSMALISGCGRAGSCKPCCKRKWAWLSV